MLLNSSTPSVKRRICRGERLSALGALSLSLCGPDPNHSVVSVQHRLAILQLPSSGNHGARR